VEQEIAPAYPDPVTGLIAGMTPSVTFMRDPLKERGRGCDSAGYGLYRTMGDLGNIEAGPWYP
jgi:hypothetical protein